MSRVFEGLEQFARFAEKIAITHEKIVSTGLAVAATKIHEKAHAIFGDNQKLADLAPSTQAERLSLGYTANDPLVRDGTLRDSLETDAGHMIAGVGSSNILMKYHELGDTRGRYPPRPVLQLAVGEAKTEISDAIEVAVAASMGDGEHAVAGIVLAVPGAFKEL